MKGVVLSVGNIFAVDGMEAQYVICTGLKWKLPHCLKIYSQILIHLVGDFGSVDMIKTLAAGLEMVFS
jgi:hypothetical protein